MSGRDARSAQSIRALMDGSQGLLDASDILGTSIHGR